MEHLGKAAFSAGAGASATPLWAPLVLAPNHKTSCKITLRVVMRRSLAAHSGPCLGKAAAFGRILLGRGRKMNGPRGMILSGMVGPKRGRKRRLWVVAAQLTTLLSLTQ